MQNLPLLPCSDVKIFSPELCSSHQRNMLYDQNDSHTSRRTYVEVSSSEILFWDRHQCCCYVSVNDILFDIEDFSVPVHSRAVLSSKPHPLPKSQPHEPKKRQIITTSSFCKMGSSSVLTCLPNVEVN